MHIVLTWFTPFPKLWAVIFQKTEVQLTAELPQLVKSKDFKLLTIRDQAPPGIGTQPL